MVQLPAVNTPQFSWCRTRLPDHPQPVPPIFEPEVPAEAVYWAATHRRRELIVGGSALKAIVATKVAPGLADRYLARTGYDSQQVKGDPVEPRPPRQPVRARPGRRGDPRALRRRVADRERPALGGDPPRGRSWRRRAARCSPCGRCGGDPAARSSRLRLHRRRRARRPRRPAGRHRVDVLPAVGLGRRLLRADRRRRHLRRAAAGAVRVGRLLRARVAHLAQPLGDRGRHPRVPRGARAPRGLRPGGDPAPHLRRGRSGGARRCGSRRGAGSAPSRSSPRGWMETCGRFAQARSPLCWSGAAAARPGDDGVLEMLHDLGEGDVHDLVLVLDVARDPAGPPPAERAWSETEELWAEQVPELREAAATREAGHAVAVMRGLTSSSGAMVAAATTSLAGAGARGPQLRLPLRLDARPVLRRAGGRGRGSRDACSTMRSRRSRARLLADGPSTAAGLHGRRRQGARRAPARAARLSRRVPTSSETSVERAVPARRLRRGAPAPGGRCAPRPPRCRRRGVRPTWRPAPSPSATASPTPACGSSTRPGGRTAGSSAPRGCGR